MLDPSVTYAQLVVLSVNMKPGFVPGFVLGALKISVALSASLSVVN
jgi:hypothetical protein